MSADGIETEASEKERPMRLDRPSSKMSITAGATLAGAVLLTVVSALASAHWLAWLQVGLLAMGVALAWATWVMHRAEDQYNARVTQRVTEALAAQSHRLGAFREIAAAGGQSLNLREVLELGLDKVLQVMGQEAAEIHLLDDDDQKMVTKASIGEPEGFLMRQETVVVGECLCGLAVLNSEPVLVADTQNDPRVTRLSCRRFGFSSAACIPLRVKGRSIGVLTVHGRDTHVFDTDDTELLVTVADQMATAIENARLYAEMEARVEALSRELQHLAVVEERERLSREMHDGLAQTLSLLSMQVGQARSLLNSGDSNGVATELEEISRVIDAGYEEVREAITSLRLTAPMGAGWLNWLQEYVYEFGLRHDLSAELQLAPDQLTVNLPPFQEIHLTRIVQEALNNVRKHARASHVQMALLPNGSKFRLRIVDDGRGFDVGWAQSRRGRYGLSTMRERAELLGGSLRVESVPGQGTIIIVEIEPDGTAEE